MRSDNNISYNKNAKAYADTSKQSPPWLYFDKPSLDSYVSETLQRSNKILELGSGSGKVIDYLCAKGVPEDNITGIDSSIELVQIARSNHPRAHFNVHDISNVRSRESAYDLILAVRIFEYLSLEALHRVVTNCYEWLKPKGKLFIIVGHPIRVNGTDISTYRQRGPRSHRVPGGIPVVLMHKTVSDYINALSHAGFSLNVVEETGASEALRRVSPSDYKRYASYGAVTLVIKAAKR
jgi:trans-aconitate methyltransferase